MKMKTYPKWALIAQLIVMVSIIVLGLLQSSHVTLPNWVDGFDDLLTFAIIFFSGYNMGWFRNKPSRLKEC